MFPISISPEEIAKLELVSFPGEIVLVDSLNDTFYAALRYLRRQKVLGFDTETRPTFTQDQHSNGTALLQLSGATRAYLFLQKYASFKAGGCGDLQSKVWEYGIRDKSVKKMTAIILGVKISKAQQLSNWEAENLSESQLRYAATDAWVCREMYMKLLKAQKHPLTDEELHPERYRQDNG